VSSDAGAPAAGRKPRILVFTTNAVSDPGVDLAGSAHLDYPVSVRVLAVPCSAGINPDWIVHAFRRGFDGVFIAADGGDCSKVADCTARTSTLVQVAQERMRAEGVAPGRLKMAAICSVCSEPFTTHMRKFSKELEQLGVGGPAPPPPAAPTTPLAAVA